MLFPPLSDCMLTSLSKDYENVIIKIQLQFTGFFYACLCVLDNELHGHLLKDTLCESISQIGQCGSGTFSYRQFGKLQSKVNRLVEHKQSFNTSQKVKIGSQEQNVSGDKRLCNSVVDKQLSKWWCFIAPLTTVITNSRWFFFIYMQLWEVGS